MKYFDSGSLPELINILILIITIISAHFLIHNFFYTFTMKNLSTYLIFFFLRKMRYFNNSLMRWLICLLSAFIEKLFSWNLIHLFILVLLLYKHYSAHGESARISVQFLLQASYFILLKISTKDKFFIAILNDYYLLKSEAVKRL